MNLNQRKRSKIIETQNESTMVITVRDGLIWLGDKSVSVQMADAIAQHNTFEHEGKQISYTWAERFVKAFDGQQCTLDAGLKVIASRSIKKAGI